MDDKRLTLNEKKRLKRLARTRTGLVILGLLIAIGFILFLINGKKDDEPLTDADAEFHFIDVGQGDGAMILAGDTCVVIDCGPTDNASDFLDYVGEYTDRIDCLVLTHAHEDHMGAASAVLNGIDVDAVLMTAYASDAVFYGRTLDAMEKHDLTPTEAVVGETYEYGDVTFEVLSPARDYGDLNNNSIVLKVTAGGTTALFTGDAEADVETEIMKTYGDRLDADILKVGHHGSSGSTTGEWLSAVSPRFASISCGKNNDYGHPHQATMNRLGEAGVEYYRTDKDGDVVLLCKDGKIAKK